MRHVARAAALVAALALAPACSPPGGQAPESVRGGPPSEQAPEPVPGGPLGGQAPEPAPDEPSIRLATSLSGQRTIDVAGLPAADLEHLERAAPSRNAWQAVLRVHVAQADPTSEELPAVLGDYAVDGGALRFTPRFPLAAGQRYEVVFDPSSLPSARHASAPAPSRILRAAVEVPAPDRKPSTRVAAVYPTGPEVPENHLRLYIVFTAPMGLGRGNPHVRLLDQGGQPVADAFLPLDVDLWNPDRTRYTVLYDPGRVKRGIRPNAELGRPLSADRRYTLQIDAAWRDGGGQPLVAPFSREFRVGPPRERALDPDAWRLDLPSHGTRDPLAVRFPVSLDYGLLQSALRVATGSGRPMAGEIEVEEGETRWTFTPREPWRPGDYQVVAAPTLEDVAGNRIGRPFEVDGIDPQGSERARGAVVPFRIGRAEAER